jgi:hypothetical protein
MLNKRDHKKLVDIAEKFCRSRLAAAAAAAVV